MDKPTINLPHYSPLTPIAKGQAPGMTAKLLNNQNGQKDYVIAFTKGDEILSGLADFASEKQITSASFTAIGALSSATTAWFDMNNKSYLLNQVEEQVELVSLIGNIAVCDGQPVVHIHYSVGFIDGRMAGGHLIKAVVNPTVELYMTTFPDVVHKKLDPATDLKIMVRFDCGSAA